MVLARSRISLPGQHRRNRTGVPTMALSSAGEAGAPFIFEIFPERVQDLCRYQLVGLARHQQVA